MKKVFLMIAAVLFMAAGTIQAQEQGDIAIGIHFASGSGDDYSNIGVGAKFQYNIIDYLRIEPSFTYFIEKDNWNMFDVSANLHYQFVLGSGGLTLYPLAGISYLSLKYSADYLGINVSDSASEIGLNVGAGLDFSITDVLNLNAELKYRKGDDWDRVIVGVGVAYKF